MSLWIERINTHPIWSELKSLGLAIDLAVAREGNDATAIDGLERIRTVLAFCGKRLAATDPVLIDPRSLTSLNNYLTVARSEIDIYVTDGVASHIVTANARADEILIALPSILAPIATDDLTVINESISSYRTTLENYLQSALATQKKLKEASASNKAKITALDAALAEEQKRLAALVLDFQSQFSTAQDKRASEFSAVLTDQQSKYATNAAEQQTQFSKDQDVRNSGYAASQIANQEKFSTLITDYTQKLKDQDKDFAEKLAVAAKTHEDNLELLKSGYADSADKILKEIESHKKDVEELVGVIGNLGITSGYQKVANLARTMLFVWQFVTVAALGGLIFIAYQMAFPSPTKSVSVAVESPQATSLTASSHTQQLSEKNTATASPSAIVQATPPTATDAAFYQGLATRIFLSLTFGIFAAYAARQASHFLEMERKNRKLALELEALGPYIAPLDKEKQDEFRLKLGGRSFGVHEDTSHKPKQDDPVTAAYLMKPKEWGEAIASLVKGIK
ncbi:MAG: hypothetical protein ABL858_07805 [Candidatus Nitrotoga sp.]